MKFEIGVTLKDKITGFKGVIMARTEYFTGCDHYGLLSRNLKDGKPAEYEWFDETRLVEVKGVKKVKTELRKVASGPFPNAPSV